ncbi:MAG: site-specific DNA-methyltransferase [Fibrobacter sp.]|nr:site-specific DNA-methyltransferase [Fibrobacter sp.]
MKNRNSFVESTTPRDERLETLKQLYPELIRDNRLDIQALKDLVGDESFDESEVGYSLYWPGKREAKKLGRKEAEGTLEPVLGDGKNEDSTNNIYIEGDNLEVLRCLKKSYASRVKMIYIDPPYNTGKDFIYPDNYTEPVDEYLKFTGQVDGAGNSLVSNPKSSGAYHRKWLDMMLPRLQLARELLTDDGVIFISIDDNEQANLKLLCDEVFGEENFAADLIWNKQHSQQQGLFKRYHEHVLLYLRNFESVGNISGGDGIIEAGAQKKISKANPASEFTFPVGVRFDAPNGTIIEGTYGDSEKSTITKGRLICKDGKTAEEVTISAGWTQKNQMKSFFAGEKVLDSKGQLVLEFFFNSAGKIKCTKERSQLTPPTVLPQYGMVSEHTEALKDLLGGYYFPTPKPVPMIKDFSSWFLSEGDVVLDFFSGSATTAHSIMQLNSEDGVNRKYIMVQLPVELDEKNDTDKNAIDFLNTIDKPHTICEIGKERIRCAGNKILGEHPELEGKLDVGFKVYRLAKSNIKAYKPTSGSDAESLDLFLSEMDKQVTPLRDGFDFKNENDIQGLLTEIILRQGFALDSRIETITTIANNIVYRISDPGRPIVLNVCLDDSIDKQTVDNIEFADDDKFICLNSSISDELYAQLSDKGRVETI